MKKISICLILFALLFTVVSCKQGSTNNNSEEQSILVSDSNSGVSEFENSSEITESSVNSSEESSEVVPEQSTEVSLAPDPMHELFAADLNTFFEAVINKNAEGIIKVIGEEKYNKATALIDSLDSEYEPSVDYSALPIDKQDTNKYMAWFLKNASEIIPSTLHFGNYEEVTFPGDEAKYIMVDINLHGKRDIAYASAYYVQNEDGGMTLVGFVFSPVGSHIN